MNVPCPYTLPQVEFVGGSTQDFAFQCLQHRTGRPLDMSGSRADFSIIEYLNKHGDPLVSKIMEVREVGGVNSQLFVSIPPEDTVDLWGKYIYQISIRNADGVMEIPNQGILYITNNIHKDFACP